MYLYQVIRLQLLYILLLNFSCETFCEIILKTGMQALHRVAFCSACSQ